MPRKSRKNVGLIGLGIIGSRAAAGLRAAGYQVFVWNRSPKPAPNFLGSPAEVAELCEIIQLFVADAQALFEVLDLIGDALTSKHLIICNATVGPEATMEAARLVEEKGAKFLDAPFTGSKGAADKRDLVYYIGGDDASFLRARPVLEATSKAIVRIGDIGHAATIKVVTNMIAAVSIQALGEALAIVQKAGLDPEILAAALEHNACRSGTMDLKLPKMVTGDYEPHFSLKHMFKDVQLGIHVANALDIEIPATTVTAGVMYGALNNGWADLDFASIYKVYESQLTPDSMPAITQSEIPKLEDLDSREVHYPETKVPAPPRPTGDAPKTEPASEASKSEPSKTEAATAPASSAPTAESESKPAITLPPITAPIAENKDLSDTGKKAEAPSLAEVLSAPEAVRTSENLDAKLAETAQAVLASLANETSVTRADMPGVPLIPADAVLPPPIGTTQEKDSAPAKAPEIPDTLKKPDGEVEKSGNAPENLKQDPRIPENIGESSPASGEKPESPKPEKKPSEAIGDKPVESKIDTSPETTKTEDKGESGSKPFNFVKNWFVSRS